MTAAHLAPHAALLAALCVLTALIRGEEQRRRHVRATEGDPTA